MTEEAEVLVSTKRFPRKVVNTLPTISATMIVKNEERDLPRCLASIKDLCDEIVIVDTGSTDDTIRIAQQFNAKIYLHPWQDDFSLHRNQAHGYATGDWHLVVDADEELLPFDITIKDFKKRLAVLPDHIGGLICTVREQETDLITASWLGCRFFRAAAKPRWKNIIHNKCKYNGWPAGTDIIINHYGYHLSPEEMKEKRERTSRLLQKRITSDPQDFDAMFYLCQTATGEGDGEEAVKWGRRCLETVPVHRADDLSFFGVIYFWMAHNYLKLRKGEEAYAWAKKGLELFPNDLDLSFVMARIGWESKRPDIAKPAAEKYIELYPRYLEGNRFGLEEDQGPFEQRVNPDDVINRTVYSLTEDHKKAVEAWLQDA